MLKPAFVLFVVLNFTVLLVAQQTQQRPGYPGRSGSNDPTVSSQPDGPKASVSGQVLSRATGAPLKKAWVVLRRSDAGRREQPFSATTKEDGRFEIKDVPAGNYNLSVTRNGYVRQGYGQRSGRQSGATLTLAPGQAARDLTFRLMPGGIISGRIVDEEGEPLARVQVMLMRYMYTDGDRRLEPRESGTTNDLGEFRIFGLEPKSYYLSARMRSGFGGFAMAEGAMMLAGADAPDEGYATVFYPGTTDVSNASAINVHAGEETRADLTLVPTRTYRVRGRVIAADGEAVKNGMVMLAPRGGVGGFMSGGNMAQIGGKEGSFEVRGVSPGAYTVTAMGQSDDAPTSARMDVEVGENNVDNVNLVLSAGREVNGVVRLEGDTSTKLTDLTVSFSPARAGNMSFGGFGGGQVKADGSFTIKNLANDDYVVNVSDRSEDSYLKSIRSAGEEFIYSGVNVARIKGPLEIIISNRGGRLEGSVVGPDSKPFQGATVVVVPEKPIRTRRGATRTANTDQYGQFTMRGLRPGTYQVYALDDADEDQYRDPEFLAKFADKATTVKVSEGSQETTSLKLLSEDSGGTENGN